jgi:hypothetical protein
MEKHVIPVFWAFDVSPGYCQAHLVISGRSRNTIQDCSILLILFRNIGKDYYTGRRLVLNKI